MKCKYCNINLEEYTIDVLGTQTKVLSYPCKCLDKHEAIETINKNKSEFIEQTPKLIRDFIINNPNADYRKLDENKSYLFEGNSGSGKTTLAIKIAREKLNKGKRCAFYKVSDLLTLLYEMQKEYRELETFNKIKSYDYLILDDLGRETYTGKRLENFFKIIDNAVNVNQQLVITANTEMLEPLVSIPAFKAIRDRIKHCEKIKFNNSSYRR